VQARFHRPELDSLRFGAFLLVFLHHALPHSADEFALGGPLAQVLAAGARAGALGVDLFFVLSSYLITELLLRERRASGTLDIRAFYVRRALRIWPLYFFALFALAPAMRLVDPRDTLPANYVAGFALLSGNWVCAFAGYPASSFALLWSVSIEEQFYLVWPWLVRDRVHRIGMFAYAMLIVALATRVVLAATGVIHPGVWCNTLARLDPIAGGALLAFYLRGRMPLLRAPLRLLIVGVGAIGMFASGGFGEHAGWGSLLTYPLAAVSAVAVLYGTLGIAWRNSTLGFLGKISFGLYVFHVAAIEIAGPVAGLPLTIVAAGLSYQYLEKPFLAWKERFALVASRPL
jgi:peptidoglycan/LPS O-acetylase OafA/YrhL